MATKPSPAVNGGAQTENKRSSPFAADLKGLDDNLKAVVLQIALILRFHADVQATGVQGYASHAPTEQLRKHTTAFDDHCDSLEQHLLMARAILERDLRRAKGEPPMGSKPKSASNSSAQDNLPTTSSSAQQPVASTSQAPSPLTQGALLTTSPETMTVESMPSQAKTPRLGTNALGDSSGSGRGGQSPAPNRSTSGGTSQGEGLKPIQLEASREGLSPSAIVASFDQPAKNSGGDATDSTAPAISIGQDFGSTFALDFNDPSSLDALLQSFPEPASGSSNLQVSGGVSSAPSTSLSPAAIPSFASNGADDSNDFLRTLGLSAGLSPFPAVSSSSSTAAPLQGLGLSAGSSSAASTSMGMNATSAPENDTFQLDSLLNLDPSLAGLAGPSPQGASSTAEHQQQPNLAPPSQAQGQQQQQPPTDLQDLDLDSLLAGFGS